MSKTDSGNSVFNNYPVAEELSDQDRKDLRDSILNALKGQRKQRFRGASLEDDISKLPKNLNGLQIKAAQFYGQDVIPSSKAINFDSENPQDSFPENFFEELINFDADEPQSETRWQIFFSSITQVLSDNPNGDSDENADNENDIIDYALECLLCEKENPATQFILTKWVSAMLLNMKPDLLLISQPELLANVENDEKLNMAGVEQYIRNCLEQYPDSNIAEDIKTHGSEFLKTHPMIAAILNHRPNPIPNSPACSPNALVKKNSQNSPAFLTQ